MTRTRESEVCSEGQVKSKVSAMHFVIVASLINVMLIVIITIVKRIFIKCWFKFMVVLTYYYLY